MLQPIDRSEPSPNHFDQARARQHATHISQQQLEKGKLFGRERHGHARPFHFVGRRIEHQIVEG